MALSGRCQILEVTPLEAWEGLKSDTSSILIDVRTRPEWKYVGIPDLRELERQVILAEWRSYPQLQVNDGFLPEVLELLGEDVPDNIYFICRSGARSLEAARMTAEALDTRSKVANCVNVQEGFEGDLNAEGHRGTVNGWKVSGLPWRQN
jgi:rhodanese-related sulfurtransferase